MEENAQPQASAAQEDLVEEKTVEVENAERNEAEPTSEQPVVAQVDLGLLKQEGITVAGHDVVLDTDENHTDDSEQ